MCIIEFYYISTKTLCRKATRKKKKEKNSPNRCDLKLSKWSVDNYEFKFSLLNYRVSTFHTV